MMLAHFPKKTLRYCLIEPSLVGITMTFNPYFLGHHIISSSAPGPRGEELRVPKLLDHQSWRPRDIDRWLQVFIPTNHCGVFFFDFESIFHVQHDWKKMEASTFQLTLKHATCNHKWIQTFNHHFSIYETDTLHETNSSHPKIGHPQRELHLPIIHFQVVNLVFLIFTLMKPAVYCYLGVLENFWFSLHQKPRG